MQAFNFTSVSDEKSALKESSPEKNYRFLAGGTTLVDLMKLHVETPAHLIDITGLPLKEIKDHGDYFMIGALATNNELAHHESIKKNLPVLSEALLSGASVQLRNLATTSGNLLQRTRCAYFRDTSAACNKRNPGSGCDAQNGINRMHAILGTSSACIASHPSDMCVALMALEAQIVVHNAEGERQIPIGEFYLLPEQQPHLENVLQPGDLITAVKVAKKPWYRNSTYVKIRDRASYAFALTSAAVAVDLKAGNVQDIRIAMGGVGTIPWRSHEAEEILKGKKLTSENIQAAAKAALAHAKPREHNNFKVELAQRTLERSLLEVGGLV